MIRFGVIIGLLILLVYRNWFSFGGTFSSGDWPYLFVENIREFSFFPETRFLWLAPYYQITTKVLVEFFSVPWEFIERFLWFYPFLALSVFSSYFLTRSFIGSLIYSTNTYILMIVSGGQMGVAMAYSIAPFVLQAFIKLIDNHVQKISNIKYQISNIKKNWKFEIGNSKLEIFKRSGVAGLTLAILTMFDPRIAYVTMLAVVVYFLLSMRYITAKKVVMQSFSNAIKIFSIPLGITTLINLFWIIPLLSGKLPAEYKGFQTIEGFDFFSFADFSHAFSLLHPNWPENIFGKVYFLQPEFLLLPMLAFVSLIFINVKRKEQSVKLQLKTQNNLTIEQFNNKTILFFVFIGIIGAFLAKGSNEPLGEVNRFLFSYIPGMTLFRDPSKFYVLIALSYSFLIPYSLSELSKKISSAASKKISVGLLLLFVGYWLFLIRPALVGNIGGTFRAKEVPKEYVRLKEFIKTQDATKTFWIPKKQRFGYSDKTHPAISASEYYLGASSSAIVKKLQQEANSNGKLLELQDFGISYIIVPSDSEHELFIIDRKYSNALRQSVIVALDALPGLEKITEFEPIIVYRITPVFAYTQAKMVKLNEFITHD